MNTSKPTYHPAVRDLDSDLRHGRLTRREFMRYATLLGLSAGTATVAAQCGGLPQPTVSQLKNAEATVPGASPTPIRRGGTYRIAMPLNSSIDHPARMATNSQLNIVRQVGEYLTETGPDNITRPYLLERWETSEDLKRWTLHLRQGITFNDGSPLRADDVLFSFDQWFNPEVGSAMANLLTYLNGVDDVEKVDDYTINLHLQSPRITVPEDLFHYQAVILPRHFEGDFLKQPVGTGAFTLTEYVDGERATFKRRADYWRLGQDGQSLPYLDELIFISLERSPAGINAMLSNEVDTISVGGIEAWQALHDNPHFTSYKAQTAGAYIVRMRSDIAPWSDVRVRNAFKLCQDRERILQLARFGEGELAMDAHVAPVHPSCAPRPIPQYDPEQARALLAEAGYPDGLQVTLTAPNELDPPEIGQALKEMAAPGGFEINLELLPTGKYWEQWTTVGFGITPWAHRPLATTVLRLAYTADTEGNPVPWNETHWVDDEFNRLVDQAEVTLDISARRRIMGRIQDIMQERGPMGNSYWATDLKIVRSTFKNIRAHPSSYELTYDIWQARD
ncbi:MAG: ABC transporter substrate-binding protein [Anaerolineae bacterium]|nr:ABC transporter substrate-binding protein [Anaerolineae bacterium]